MATQKGQVRRSSPRERESLQVSLLHAGGYHRCTLWCSYPFHSYNHGRGPIRVQISRLGGKILGFCPRLSLSLGLLRRTCPFWVAIDQLSQFPKVCLYFLRKDLVSLTTDSMSG